MLRRQRDAGAARPVQRSTRWWAFIGTGIVCVVMSGVAAYALVTNGRAGPQGDGTAVTPTGWEVTPAGRQIKVGERPYGLALSPDGGTLLVSNNGVNRQSLMAIDVKTGRVEQTLHYPAPEALFLGVTFSPDGRRAYASGGVNDEIRTYDVRDGRLSEGESIALETSSEDGGKLHPFPAGIAVSPDGRTLYVADNLENALSIVDVESGDEQRVALSKRRCEITDFGDPSNGRACLFPYTVALSRDGAKAYVSNWGQKSVAVVNTKTRSLSETIEVGTHPSALAVSPTRDELYVANTDSDSVAVVDTASNTVKRTTSLAPYRRAPVGTNPNALAVSPNGRRLYVAGAGNNDVIVLELGARRDKRLGYIPTGWYPTGVALDPTGRRLYVANAKGLGAGPNPRGPNPTKDPSTTPDQYIGSMIEGTVSIIDLPRTRASLRPLTEQVIANAGFDKGAAVRNPATDQHVVPTEPGQRSPIKHVIYVVNENRTYDQVLGDLDKGNGDPSLTLFPRKVTPNHHKLAERFTVLDNLYAAGEVSNDGWEWSTAANANTLDQKTWPTSYGGRGYFYTGEGGTLGAAPGREPEQSYIWDLLDRAGLRYRNYGFWATGTTPVRVFNEPNLAARTDPDFPGYNLKISDQTRFAAWLEDFRRYERLGRLPAMQFVKFPQDHTCGTSPDCPTPQAMVADSDWATGKLVDAVSHSRFWKDTAIFVIEDDAQDGPDHVDAHRTIGHVISPYTQTQRVDSGFYSSVSMLRTMELILGLGPLTQFDAAANPMYGSFTDEPDLSPYDAIKPEQPLDEMNQPSAPLARESQRMNFSREDQAPWRRLNEAIWKGVRGASSKMPEPVHRLDFGPEEEEGE